MSERPWWLHALQWIAWGIAMCFTMMWLGRSRNRPVKMTTDGSALRDPSSVPVLIYPPSIAIIGAAAGILFLPIGIAAFFAGEGNLKNLLSLFFLAFSSLGWLLVVGFFVEFHELRPDGIRFRTTWLRTGFVAWAEIEEISYRPRMGWFAIQTKDGRRLRISIYLVGLPEFAQKLAEMAPDISASEQTQKLLQETAAGNPPLP